MLVISCTHVADAVYAAIAWNDQLSPTHMLHEFERHGKFSFDLCLHSIDVETEVE